MDRDMELDKTSWIKFLVSTFKAVHPGPGFQPVRFVQFLFLLPFIVLGYLLHKLRLFRSELRVFFIQRDLGRLYADNVLLKSDDVRALLSLKNLVNEIENRSNGDAA